jgi:hypothetical protein
MVSSNHGTTWSSELVLSTIDSYPAWEPQMAVDDIGNVYDCWQDAKYGSSNGYSGKLLLRKSADNGQTWQAEQRISALRSAARSSIATAGADIHIVWEDQRFGWWPACIYYRGSVDYGLTWCDEVALGDTSGNPVVAASDSTVYAAWSSHGMIMFQRGRLQHVTATRERATGLPGILLLNANYPNPFNQITNLRISVTAMEHVRIRLYDVLGQEVEVLCDGVLTPGTYHISIEGSNLPSGVYMLRVESR